MGASLSLSISESSASKTDNTSKITATLKVSSNSGSWNGSSQYGYIEIDGTKYTFHSSFKANTTTTLSTASKTVKHDSDGGGKITVRGYYQTGVSAGNISTSRTYTLDTINRTYTVKYSASGASNVPSSQTKTYGKTLTLSSKVPTKTGYKFKEWNTKSGGTGTSYSPGGAYKTNASVTLYAIWTENTYTLVYNAGPHGSFKNVLSSTSSDTLNNTLKYFSSYSVPENSILRFELNEGYEFNYWLGSDNNVYYTGGLVKAASAALSPSNLSLTAITYRKTIPIFYYANNALIRSTSATYGDYYSILSCPPAHIPAGKKFMYWNLRTGDEYSTSVLRRAVAAGLVLTFSYTPKVYLVAVFADIDAESFNYYEPDSVQASPHNLIKRKQVDVLVGDTFTFEGPDISDQSNFTFSGKWSVNGELENKFVVGSTYLPTNVFPKTVPITMSTNHTNQSYDRLIVEDGYQVDKVTIGSGLSFYPIYIDNAPSEIQYTGIRYDYIDLTNPNATIDRYVNYILEGTDYSAITINSQYFMGVLTFVSTASALSTSLDVKNMNVSIGDIDLEVEYRTRRLESTNQIIHYLFIQNITELPVLGGTYTVTISNLKDNLSRELEVVQFVIKPPTVIQDINRDGKVVAYFATATEAPLGDDSEQLQISGGILVRTDANEEMRTKLETLGCLVHDDTSDTYFVDVSKAFLALVAQLN